MSVMDPPSPEASAREARECELELVARLRAGDDAAFEAVYAAFNARLFNFLARLCRRRDVAEDLLEETWLRVVHGAAKMREDTRLGPFLFTVARNLYVSYCRSRSIEDQHAPSLVGLWPSGLAGPSPFDATIARETGERLDAALAALPAVYREALLLVGFEGMPPREAAIVCGVSPEAMRQRISRARAMLARELDERDASVVLQLKAVTT
jgi:RNA polymerase sigma-70 factor (ECF subfamily)